MKLLHIDDNKQILEPFEFYFDMNEGVDYTSCSDPIEGLKLIKEGKFDAVLLDLAMPKMSGYEIIDNLQQSGDIKKQKIIVFSASNQGADELEELKSKGVHSFIAKTTPINKILTHVNDSMGVMNVTTY
ncbi:MAG: response regulator [Nitrosopumilus sp.]